ncbi:efflux RND transporter periplasmic adaptor subunit [Aquitalea sp. LB_tupeE]|uniref:efflux RND transporter periplasmic adaptor subunit n=1 Tax=Aquitalea sp. LB_tupeE TaxID=2748078 RepID=UPI0015BBBDEF|nr:efflux RND transporter periplasmic adaptor subunit [Aquitalea sp. LB_tupeE]NWK76525.1 efflux RND transporter periplasmic adaptor subunit [Aquitalea sp. LB_tupeE]
MTDQRHANQGVPAFHHDTLPGLDGRDKVARRARTVSLIIVLLLLAGLGRTLLARQANADTLAKQASQSAIQQVRVVQAQNNRHDNRLTLPGTLQGMREALVYARGSGYVKQWLKDIGQPVKKGELLAVLDTPDIAKQVDEAAASHELARTAYQRWSRLRAQDAVSQQELDEKTAAFQQTQATLQRLRDQQDFARIVAPFDGIVTKRNIDNGSLVNAGNGGSGQALFSVAQVDQLHLYVYLPQDRANQVKVGDPVDIALTEGGKPLAGKVARTAGAIDPASRTLQVEVVLPNAQHQLLPGQYVEASFKMSSPAGLTLPTNTLIFGSEGSQVAVVDEHNKVRLQKVALGTDYGKDIAIKAGLSGKERIILNPSDAIHNGQSVAIVASDKGE